MVGGNIDDDEYVAKLLKQDAKTTAKKYEMIGLDAFRPQRTRTGAPKPNTNFLRHIIRQTDNHNAALLAKEAEEARARLQDMNNERDKERRVNRDRERQRERTNTSRGAGRLTPPEISTEDEGKQKRKRSNYSDDEDERDSRRRQRRQKDSWASKPRKEREEDRNYRMETGKREGGCEDESSERRSRHSKHSHDHGRRYKDYSDEDNYRSRREKDSSRKHKRRGSRSRSPALASSTNRHHRISSRRHGSRSPAPTSRSIDRDRPKVKGSTGAKHLKGKSPSPDSGSDPLEAIVGPLPPRAHPVVRSRGRGAHKENSIAMDARFSTTYNPSTDLHIDSDLEDDWGDALEALKDRDRWKQQGAERLKAAGFSDDQVKKWANGEEKTEEDVRWTKRGEGREWDRGKVVDEDGDVDLKAEWGRLK